MKVKNKNILLTVGGILGALLFAKKKQSRVGAISGTQKVYIVYFCKYENGAERILYAVPCSSYAAAVKLVNSNFDSRPGVYATFEHDNGSELLTTRDL